MTLPFSLEFILINSEPGVRDFLAVARKTSPPSNAPPAGEAGPADRLAPLRSSFIGPVPSRHTACELLQRGAQRHDGIHSW